MKKLIAKTQLTGDYGTVHTGDHFEAADDVAKVLTGRGDADYDGEESTSAEAEDDTDSDKKDDKGAAGRQTKTDKTVTTGNLQ